MFDKLDENYLRRLLRKEQERLDLASHLLIASARYRQWALGHPAISSSQKTPEERASLNAKAAQAAEFARRVLASPIDHGDKL